MLLLGIDVGTSSIKASVVDSETKQVVASAQYPDTENTISSPQPNWAEQDPETWWEHTRQAIKRANASGNFNPKDIVSIGISYQMHGLVMIDEAKKVLRPSIIWCDSRAVEIGEKAFQEIGEDACLSCLLNSPGNFTASKLAWVKENEREVYDQCHKIMLPGDFIGMKFSDKVTTTNSALSEGIFWDFRTNALSEDIFDYYGFSRRLIPEIQPVFSNHGEVTDAVANDLGLKAGIPVAYKAGDQPNNALSLNVLNPGEIAATAGTSGVVYAVSDKVSYDEKSRINSFAHVNHQMNEQNRIGILLCINGTGILNRWVKENITNGLDYQEMNEAAAKIPIGSDGLSVLPFGNGAERILQNKQIGAAIENLNFNVHTSTHIVRAAQEGIAFSLKYGFDMMLDNGVTPKVIRAGKANMFLSDIFSEALVNATQTPVELYDTDGAKGAALAGGFGAGQYNSIEEAMNGLTLLQTIEPQKGTFDAYSAAYETWAKSLNRAIK
ncbi:MAG: FGGY family carbohydrate kinase [Spirosomataceae bacterium]|jgi:xylulokinase